jgi:hypothetical protein
VAGTRDELLGQRRENRAIAGWVIGLTVAALFAYGAWVMFRYTMRGDLNCHVPGTDSEYGESSWGWLPPGETCTYPHHPTVATTRPSWIIPAVLVALLLVAVSALVLAEVRARKHLRQASKL